MTSKIRFAVAVLTFLGMIGLSVHDVAAMNEKRQNYIQFNAGAFFPTGDMDDNEYDTGFDGGITYGRYLNEFLIFEGSADYFTADSEVIKKDQMGRVYKQDNYLGVGAFLVTLKGEISLGPMDLYGGAGVGLYIATLYSDVKISGSRSFDTDESDVVFGGQFVLGANFNITEHFFIGVDGVYRITDEVDISESVVNVPVEYVGDLDGFSLLGSFGFRF